MSAALFDRGAQCAVRDPLLAWTDGSWHLLHTAVRSVRGGGFALRIDIAESQDLRTWTVRSAFPESPENFSSPGSLLRIGDEWILGLQSYPIDPGSLWGNDEARLWTARSRDLRTWEAPRPMRRTDPRLPAWAPTPRQIDPFLIAHGGRMWCLYKAAGQLGLQGSGDLESWSDASPERPSLAASETPDGSPMENPCVVAVDGRFALFFSPCREGRGIGIAWSDDLRHWRDARYLDFPALSWAPGGPTAAMVVDRRAHEGGWLMAFHGDRPSPGNGHDAAISFARSADLLTWRLLDD